MSPLAFAIALRHNTYYKPPQAPSYNSIMLNAPAHAACLLCTACATVLGGRVAGVLRFAAVLTPTQPPRKAADCPMHTFSASLQKCASSVYGLPSLPFVTRTG